MKSQNRSSRLVKPATPETPAVVVAETPVTPVPTPVVEPVRPVTPSTPAVVDFGFAATVMATVSAGDGRTFDVPVSPVIARIVAGIRAVSAVGPVDTPELFAERVRVFRAAWDTTGPPVVWSGIGINRSAIGSSVMDTQNAVMAAMVVAGVPMWNCAVMAVWRGLIPVTKCPFETRRYGVTSLADFAAGRARPRSVPTVPDGAYNTAVAVWYATGGMAKPWAVTVPTVG